MRTYLAYECSCNLQWKLNWREKYELVDDNKFIWIKFTVSYIENLILDIGRSEFWV